MPLWLALLLGWIVGACIVGAVVAACLSVLTRDPRPPERDPEPPPQNDESPTHR